MAVWISELTIGIMNYPSCTYPQYYTDVVVYELPPPPPPPQPPVQPIVYYQHEQPATIAPVHHGTILPSLGLNLPCNTYPQWDHNNDCFSYYSNGCYNECRFVNMCDIEDFMWVYMHILYHVYNLNVLPKQHQRTLPSLTENRLIF